MKIKKIDDKPLVIHKKEKAKLHIKQPKEAAIKGSNIYTVDRSPLKKKTITDKEINSKGTLSRLKDLGKQKQQSIKVNNKSLHVAGAVGAKTATDQMEGGKELQQSAMIAYEASRPVTGTASRGAKLFQKQVIEKKIKKVNTSKKIAKKAAKDTAKNVAKKAAKETTKEVSKAVAKETTKVATSVAATAAGTTVAPGVGTAIGIAAGYATGVAIEQQDAKIMNRNRKLKFFLDKMQAQENQQDSLGKLVKDLIFRQVMVWVKAIAPIVGLALLLMVLIVAIVAIPVIAVVAVMYNSPFALFLPPLEDGDTVTTVASAYVAEFNRDINTLANNHTGYDEGRIIYVDYEGESANPSNYWDILAVYMVKHGVGDTATIMNDKSKGWLQTIVKDMCTYTTSNETVTETIENEDGTTTTQTTTYLNVNVTLKSYTDMIAVYGFSSEEIALLKEMMSPEYLEMLGYTGGGGDPGVSELTASEVNAIVASISDPKAKAACTYALYRVGYPYSQALRHSGEYYDCSSLVYYAWKDAGVDISYGGATTAAYEAQGLANANKTVVYDEMQPGDLIFYSFEKNGAYLNITHVGIYVGNGKIVDARGTAYGVVYRDVPAIGSIVLIGRP